MLFLGNQSQANRNVENQNNAEHGSDNRAAQKSGSFINRKLHRQRVSTHVVRQNRTKHTGIYADRGKQRRDCCTKGVCNQRRQADNTHHAQGQRAHRMKTFFKLGCKSKSTAQNLIDTAQHKADRDKPENDLIQ